MNLAAAWHAEERKGRLEKLLAERREPGNLTKAQVTERMEGKPPVMSRLENSIIKANVDTPAL